MGVLIQAVVINIGLYFFIVELNQCMTYFDTLKNNIAQNFASTPLVNSLLLNILFFEKKDVKFKNLNFKKTGIDLEDFKEYKDYKDLDFNLAPSNNIANTNITTDIKTLTNLIHKNNSHNDNPTNPSNTNTYLKPKLFNYTKILKPDTLYISDLYSDNIIYEFVLNVYYPILFICFIILIKVI